VSGKPFDILSPLSRHTEGADIEAHQIVRLNPSYEGAIAELAEASAKARAAADILEREIAADAGAIIDRFLGRVDELTTTH